MIVNKISEQLASRGLQNVIPEEKILNSLGVQIKSWNKWVNKKSDPQLWQLPIIASFLNCEVSELLPNNKKCEL